MMSIFLKKKKAYQIFLNTLYICVWLHNYNKDLLKEPIKFKVESHCIHWSIARVKDPSEANDFLVV